MTALLEVRGLRVGYGELPVLQGIDFDVEAGSRTVLLGLNGAGKTTTVESIAGLLKPWGGTITFDGKGSYSATGQLLLNGGAPAALSASGTYSVSPGGFVKLTNRTNGLVIGVTLIVAVTALLESCRSLAW